MLFSLHGPEGIQNCENVGNVGVRLYLLKICLVQL
jgi:hypothetical protein